MSPRGTIDARHIWKRFRADRRRMLLRDELEHLRNAMRGQSSNRWRWALVFATQLFFYGMPWVQWGGRQALLFDLVERRFYILGLFCALVALSTLKVR